MSSADDQTEHLRRPGILISPIHLLIYPVNYELLFFHLLFKVLVKAANTIVFSLQYALFLTKYLD